MLFSSEHHAQITVLLIKHILHQTAQLKVVTAILLVIFVNNLPQLHFPSKMAKFF